MYSTYVFLLCNPTFKVSSLRSGELEYTDDTAMARCVAESLIDNNGQLNTKDLAKK